MKNFDKMKEFIAYYTNGNFSNVLRNFKKL